MSTVLTLAMRETPTLESEPEESSPVRTVTRDVYDLDAVDLSAFTGLIVSAACDQRFLAARRGTLDTWVRHGGRLLVNGHPMLQFVTGLPELRRLHFHGIADLQLTATGEHPIWDGIDRQDLLLRTGVEGQHTFAELMEIGVAGFYSHAYLANLPVQTVTVTGIGAGQLPVDVSYPLGDGEVIVHAGNDLTGFADPRTSTANLTDRIYTHLEG
jgi:hypothetical protein